MFTLNISFLTTSSLPWSMDLVFQIPIQYCSLQHWTLLPSSVTTTTGCCFHFGSVSSFFLELFPHSSPVAYWAPTDLGSSSFSVLSFCLFILFMGFSRQEYWSGLPFPPPVDHIVSELSTMTHLSWVALHGLTHSFIELDMAVIKPKPKEKENSNGSPRGGYRGWLDGITNSVDMTVSKLQVTVKDSQVWHAAVHGVAKSWILLRDGTTTISSLCSLAPVQTSSMAFVTVLLCVSLFPCQLWILKEAPSLNCQSILNTILGTCSSFGRVQLFVTPRTVASQAPLSMEFSRQEYWSGLSFFLQGTFPTQGSNPGLLHCRKILYHFSYQGNPWHIIPGT